MFQYPVLYTVRPRKLANLESLDGL